MKSIRIKAIITVLAIATFMTVGSGTSQAQKFNFGGKSFGKRSSGGSNSSNSGNSSQRRNNFNQSNLRGKFTQNAPKIRTGFNNQKSKPQGLGSFPKKFDLKSNFNTREIRSQVTGHLKGSRNLTGAIQNSKSGSWLNSNLGKVHHHIRHNQQHHRICVSQRHWCNEKPKHCHWWYDWCKPIRYCEPAHYVTCHWNYVTCDADVRWYLGMKGLLLPGQGIGIETVTPGSPAAQVGLQAGMVITRCNGIDLFDEAALGDAISHSKGALHLDLLLSANGPPATCVVVMQRVTSVSY